MTDERDTIRVAIKQWWQGGGTTTRIIDVLEREGASEKDARFVAAKLAAAAGRLSVITDGIITSELEKAQAFGSAGATPIDRGHDSMRCNFDMNPCRECGAWDPIPLVHGALVVANLAETEVLRPFE